MASERTRWQPLDSKTLTELEGDSGKSIAVIYKQITENGVKLEPYEAGGAEKATTTVDWSGFNFTDTTTLQMHSELVACRSSFKTIGQIEVQDSKTHQIKVEKVPLWYVNDTGQVKAGNGETIEAKNYSTDLPHCGYCTIMLYVLGLPLTTPTKGRFGLASHLNYPLPAEIKENINTLALLLNGNQNEGETGLIRIKEIINCFIQTPAPAKWALRVKISDKTYYVSDAKVSNDAPHSLVILHWIECKNRYVTISDAKWGQMKLLDFLWKLVYKGINLNLDK